MRWNPYPRRHRVLIARSGVNEHGVEFFYCVRGNRNSSKFWLEILAGTSLPDCASTSSRRVADGWVEAISEGVKRENLQS